MKLSVVIPCHATRERSAEVGQQLWYTVASVLSDLQETFQEGEYEILAVMNGEYPMTASLLHEAGSVRAIFAGPHVNSPQSARDMGVKYSSGETIFFFDAHVIIPPGFFRTVLDDMDATGADFMGVAHRFLGKTFYAHRVAWDEYLWGGETIIVPPNSYKPIKTGVHPHGAFAIRREAYDEVGGYWLALKGFGGEEPQLDYKLWLMGKTVWVTPRTYHWHWLPPGGRRGSELFRDKNFVRNFLMVAAAYGGKERMKQSHEAMKAHLWGGEDLFPMMDQAILNDQEVLAERHVIECKGVYKNLEELRAMWDATGVLH